MTLVEDIYTFMKSLLTEETFNLSSQFRRVAVSVPSNISDGHSRKSNKELLICCYISLGCLAEIKTQLILLNRIYLLDNNNSLTQTKKLNWFYLD